ncbi:type II toxin-antitoxin system RelE/ParE family toxin [Candidatus Shapirobacteria bacterium]|nr:type II toxin-antitoxin system RelE/ParE family toxin [Candidatus Shapirobacteria bacterium]
MTLACRVVYYISSSGENPVKDFLDSIGNVSKTKVFRIFALFENYGLSSIIPHTRKLAGTPFWEIRILGKDNIRVIYVLPQQDRILALHGFVKKGQKTPVRELALAYKRYYDWLKRHS